MRLGPRSERRISQARTIRRALLFYGVKLRGAIIAPSTHESSISRASSEGKGVRILDKQAQRIKPYDIRRFRVSLDCALMR